ncbi:MAG: DNA polymerase III subunit beta [Rickettsiaceae bacterium]|nr:DNA polymerase III subunit beta [Rickettsiaceae bacterium]
MSDTLNILINTKEFAYALHFAASVVEKRNVVSELSNIKLKTKGSKLEIGATDMDLYLNQEIDAKIMSEGETTISAQLLAEIIRKIPDEYIEIFQSDNLQELTIKGRSCNFTLLTLPVTNFPIMEEMEASNQIKVPCQQLLRIIESTNFSISNDETRYNLNGLYLHIKQGNLYSASTDGHRLSIAAIKDISSSGEIGVIIPKKTIIELNKLIKDSKNLKSDISIEFSSTKIRFECNDIVLVSKLIDGSFPDYSAFIPQNNHNKLIISTKQLAESIERIAVITVEKFRAIKFFITPQQLKLSATGEARGVATESLEYTDGKDFAYEGDDIAIGFNPKYWSDVLSAIQEQHIQVFFKDPTAPVLIKSYSDQSCEFVIMPVKI